MAHNIARRDIREFLAGLRPSEQWDLAVVDPPTFSNSKGMEVDWMCTRSCRIADAIGGTYRAGKRLYFSTNFRRFKLDEAALGDYIGGAITRQTIPEDFRNERIHNAGCLRGTVEVVIGKVSRTARRGGEEKEKLEH